MRELVFTCQLPPAALSPNGGHRHVHEKAKAKKLYRADCCACAMRARCPQIGPLKRARIDLEFFCARKRLVAGGKSFAFNDGLYRPLDKDNAVAAFKAGQDGIVDSGVVVNDSAFEIGTVAIHRTQKECNGKIGVVVTITELE